MRRHPWLNAIIVGLIVAFLYFFFFGNSSQRGAIDRAIAKITGKVPEVESGEEVEEVIKSIGGLVDDARESAKRLEENQQKKWEETKKVVEDLADEVEQKTPWLPGQ